MPFLTLRDGAQLFYKDWNHDASLPAGQQPTVLFSHGWPLNSDDWDVEMFVLAGKGCRVLAHDRRGHGRSEQTWAGNDVDNWADDIAELVEKLDLKELVLVGHSTGGGDIARYCLRRECSLL